jgi:hypothetical protein
MHIRGLLAALVLAHSPLFGQLGSGSVVVTSSQSSNLQPDQAVFSVTVGSGIDRGLDQIISALAGTGISAANLSGLSFQSSTGIQAAPLDWDFQLIVPLANIKSTTASLTSLQRTIAQNTGGFTLSFSLEGTQVSAGQSQTCDFGSLMNDARSRAQNIAGAAGFNPGAVAGVTGSISQSVPDCQATVTFGLPVPRSGPNTITIAASRTTNPTPDQVLIAINVTSDTTYGLDDINAALAGAGIAGTNLTVYSGTTYDRLGRAHSILQWSFTLTAALAKLQSTLAQLVAAQAVMAQNSALSLAFNIQGLQASPQSVPVCQEADLISDARWQAQKIGSAAGVSVGPILNISEQAAPTAGLIYASFLIGDFSVGTTPSSSCSLSVQFQLL